VHTLVCEQHLWFAVPCLRSLITYSEDPITLVLHDDGSTTQKGIELLLESLPGAIFVSRKSADAEIGDALAKFPHMAKARTHLAYVLAMWDLTFTHPEPIARYIDSDILFQRRFRGLYPVSARSATGAFMRDCDDCYAAHPADFWPFGPLRLPSHCNAGMFWIERDRIDYDRMEYLFKRWGPARIRKYDGWIAQTFWADQAWRAGCSVWDPTQLGIASAVEEENRRLIGVHYVTPRRNMLKAALQSAADAREGEAEAGSAEEIRLGAFASFGVFQAALVVARNLAARGSAG
jgi:hypothetical protein